MADENLCKLCQADRALEVDLEKASYKSANNLLQRLFHCYNIDVSVLGESPATCKPCFQGVLQISEQLEKWRNAQKVLRKTSCLPDIDNHMAISVKVESKALWDENDDAVFPSEDSLGLDETSNSNEFLHEEKQTEDLEFLYEEEPQTEDIELLYEEPQTEGVESFAEGPSINRSEEVSAKVYEELFGMEQIQEKSTELIGIEQIEENSTDPLDWRLTSHEFFCVCLGPDGLALAVLFTDNTPQSNIRMLCTCCNQVLATVSDIQKHSLVRRAHPEYWCRFCGIYFPSITDLQFHEEYQNHQILTSNCVFRCLKCAKINSTFINAIRHQNNVHDKVSFDCKKCSVSFESRMSLAKHELKHKNHVLCCYPSCQQKFRRWKIYVKHLNWHRSAASRYPVPVKALENTQRKPSKLVRWSRP